jgi:Ca2+-binding EF-hand superfamily protein
MGHSMDSMAGAHMPRALPASSAQGKAVAATVHMRLSALYLGVQWAIFRRSTVVRSLIGAFGAMTLAMSSASVAQTAPAAGAPKALPRAAFVKDVDTRFGIMDSNKDGSLSKGELQTAQARALQDVTNLRQKQVEAQFKQLDTNKDGQLSVQEFAALAPTVRSSETPDQMLQQLDTNKDGKVSPDEFRAPQLAKFARFDANHDGVLTPDEMRKAVSTKK